MCTKSNELTQTFFANQDEMIASSWKVKQMAETFANQAKLFSLLSSNSEGIARPMEAIISYTEMMAQKIELLRDAVKQKTEADLILKQGTLTVTAAETRDLVNPQHHSNNAGLELFQAVGRRDAGKIQTLLSASTVQSYINYTDEKGRTPLFRAAAQGDTLIVAQLIAAHSNVDLAKTTDGTTPLFIAAQNGHASVARQLIEARCNVDLALKTNGATPLHVAASKGHARVIKQLIAGRCKVDIQDKKGYTPFFIAAHKRHFDIVEQLINARCKTDLASTGRLTTVSIYYDIIKQLTNARCKTQKRPKWPQQG